MKVKLLWCGSGKKCVWKRGVDEGRIIPLYKAKGSENE